MFTIRGENVYPSEIDSVKAQIQRDAGAAAFGNPEPPPSTGSARASVEVRHRAKAADSLSPAGSIGYEGHIEP